MIRGRTCYFGYFHNFMPGGFDGINIALICSELKQCRKNSNMGNADSLIFIECEAIGASFFRIRGCIYRTAVRLSGGAGTVLYAMTMLITGFLFLICCFFRSFFPLSAAIFCAEPRHKRISNAIGAKKMLTAVSCPPIIS